MKGKLILALGGSRSGKSELAEKIAASLGERIVYVATAAVRDDEMADRVRRHRERRPQSWETVEEEKNVIEEIRKGREGDVFLLDCASVWITNLLLDENVPKPGVGTVEKEAYIVAQATLLANTVESGVHLIVVSNEVGLGLVPEYPLGRIFRDVAGRVNQMLAAKADQVYFTVAGIPLEIKSISRAKME